ncbi:MAG: hypothetical protein E6713_07360, partial [Sporomusaceae bacterium]|nr:hypothetical protein [Sporomusaceae bacterium]
HVDNVINPLHAPQRLLCFNVNNYKSVLKNYGIYVPKIELIQALKDFLKIHKDRSEGWQWENYQQRIGYKTCVFDEAESFHVFDRNLFLYLGQRFYLVVEQNLRTIYKMYSEQHGIPLIPIPTKTEFRYMRNLIIETVSSNCTGTNFSKARLPYFKMWMKKIVFYQERHSNKLNLKNEAEKNKISQSSGQILETKLIIPNKLSEEELFVRALKQILTEESIACPEVSKILFALTEGNIEKLNQLAKLIAYINGIQTKKKAYIIIGHPARQKNFHSFLNYLYNDQSIYYIMYSQLIKAKEHLSMIERKYYGGQLILISHSSNNPQFIGDGFRILKRMIKNKSITQRHVKGSVGEFVHDNTSTCICFLKNASTLNYYRMYLNTEMEIIDLGSTGSDTDFLDFEVSQKGAHWFHLVLATYGLQLLKSQKRKEKLEYDKMRIVNDFIEACCTIDTDVTCYTSDLYNAYKSYFLTRYSADPINKEELKRLIGSSCDICECRPRHTAKDYRRGLKGITLNDEKMNEYFIRIKAGKKDTYQQNDAYIVDIYQKTRPILEMVLKGEELSE